jgi:hypothetical protein
LRSAHDGGGVKILANPIEPESVARVSHALLAKLFHVDIQ